MQDNNRTHESRQSHLWATKVRVAILAAISSSRIPVFVSQVCMWHTCSRLNQVTSLTKSLDWFACITRTPC